MKTCLYCGRDIEIDVFDKPKKCVCLEDLTEYKVEITVARKGSCYVMAKDHEEAVEIFEKKLEHGYDEDKSISWFDFDDEFKVDDEEVDP